MQRGISPTVSFVLSVAIIIIFTAATYYWATGTVKEFGEQGRVRSYYNQMVSLERIIKQVAAGDENFTTMFVFYHPQYEYVNPYLSLDEENDRITLVFNQYAAVIGYPGDSARVQANESCGYDYLLDNVTGIVMYRLNEYETTYQGAAGPGTSQTEVAACFPDIDLVWGDQCGKGKVGPETVIIIRKENVTNGRPVVSVSMC